MSIIPVCNRLSNVLEILRKEDYPRCLHGVLARRSGGGTGLATPQPKQEQPMLSENSWTDGTITRLKQLWSEGHSTAEIGRRLNVSKNAVIGKAHRLDLPGRLSPIRRSEAERQHRGGLPPPRRGGTALATLPMLPCVQRTFAIPTAGPNRAVTHTLSPQSPTTKTDAGPFPPRKTHPCCWPIGEPGSPSFRFCDVPALPGKPYCKEHAHRAYLRQHIEKIERARL